MLTIIGIKLGMFVVALLAAVREDFNTEMERQLEVASSEAEREDWDFRRSLRTYKNNLDQLGSPL